MATLNELTIQVREWAEVGAAKRKAARMARNIGFSGKAIEEISIVISELAENLIAHNTVEGKIICSTIEDHGQKGIQIISLDRGPGITDIGKALQDGFSRKNSLGIGLGAVKRLMDEFDLSSKTERSGIALYEDKREGIGTVIMARKWLHREEKPEKGLRKTRFAVMSRPKHGETYNGDRAFLHYFEGKTIVALIDGVGHGKYSEEAAREADLYLMDNYQKSLERIITEMHMKLRKTRGVVISIALIDDAHKTMEYVGIGNILTRVVKSPVPVSPANYNGIVGATLQSFKCFTHPWSQGNVIIMTSDGISDKYDLTKYPGLIIKHPVIIANIILRDYGRASDDATVIVGGPA
ncbi:MAG: ATP-binding protein [bacterium]